jgi:hypothetical protein
MDYLEAAKSVQKMYMPLYKFSDWVIDPDLWKTFDFDKTIVYYNKESDLSDVQLLVKEREPCNIGMNRFYSHKLLKKTFGYQYGAYQKSTVNKLMPNIAIYCKATVSLPSGYKKAHVINLIGYAFDTKKQPDSIYFQNRDLSLLVDKYHDMWKKAYVCACDLKEKGEINKIKIYNVGGVSFAGKYGAIFHEKIFEPAFLPLLPLFEKEGINVLGYNLDTKDFDGGHIPNILDEDVDMEHTLYVNAWDPWSLIGNGNNGDGSLDGYWGGCSNMAVLGWSLTNPLINYRAV